MLSGLSRSLHRHSLLRPSTPFWPYGIIIIIIILLESAVQGRERVRTLSVQRPQPHTTNPWKEEKDKTVGDKKRKNRSCQQESIGSALETCQSHTIKHRVTKIFPKRHREGHKASAILRSPTTRRHERVPMSNQSTTSNTRWHIRQRQCTA